MSDEDDDYYYRFFIKHYRRAISGEPYLRPRTYAELQKINALLDKDPYLIPVEERAQYEKELNEAHAWIEERRLKEIDKAHRRNIQIHIRDRKKKARQKTTDRIKSKATPIWLCPTHLPDRLAELYEELEERNLYIPEPPNVHNRKLSPADVVVIRTLFQRYRFRQRDVATYYNIDVSVIGTIKRGKVRPDLNPL